MGHLTFLGGDLNAHSPLWDTNQPSDARGEQLEDWVIAHSASVLNDGTATLLNWATSGLSSPDVSLAHPSLADKAGWTVGEDLGSDHRPITIELRCQTPVASDPHKVLSKLGALMWIAAQLHRLAAWACAWQSSGSGVGGCRRELYLTFMSCAYLSVSFSMLRPKKAASNNSC